MASTGIGRTMVVAPQIATPSAHLILGQHRVLICPPPARQIFDSQTQVPNLLVHCPRRQGHIRALSIIGEPRQQANGSSCKTIREQASKLAMVALAATTLVAATSVNVAQANAVESLEFEAGVVFERSCAGCHTGGGNILQPAATLFKEDLEKNGVPTADDIYNITYFGKNRMPGYGEKCTPRGQCTFGPRLSEENIRALAEFVKLQADQGWPK